ncbi:MAG: phenylalanine--tRNA ligase subunit beta [Candidatus Omnitrophica bacterium]|nr:phenylalanine--tRNA ligase subunit beta [Candidatus Omnitrophota bacterium]
MKLTYNWLKDFVDIKLGPEELADKLTMAGIEVKSIEHKDGDFVFEIEITSNRPDWLSVIGIAREISAITNSKLKTQSSKLQLKTKSSKKENRDLKILVEDKKDCPLYTAKIIKNVSVGPSPGWLKRRLELIGCRSVNNIVDITNYVLFTYGEPLHAFDLHKLNSDTIIVRRAKDQEKIVSIDGVEHPLGRNILVIADKNKPIAIAGIMGGKDTEVSFSTKDILLEAAVFDPVVTRRARQALGMQTDSSYRFERGLDFATAVSASASCAGLILEIAGGQLASERSCGVITGKEKTLVLDIRSVNKVLGVDIKAPVVKNILIKLGFSVKNASSGKFLVKSPLFRQDVNSEIDLIEEVARIFGYQKLPLTLPRISPQIDVVTPRDLAAMLRRMLFGLGLNEAITYSLIDKDLLEGFDTGSLVEIMNPLSREQEVLRPLLAPSMLKCIAYNLNQKQGYVNLFEIANIFRSQQHGAPKEELALNISLCGARSAVLENGLLREELGLLHLKGVLEAVFERFGITQYSFTAEGQGKIAIAIEGEKIGFMMNIKESILSALDIKNKNVATAEVSLGVLFQKANLNKKFIPLPVYPGIARDISFVIKDDILAEDILTAIRENSPELLRLVRIADIYKGKQIPQGMKGLTISCLYRSDERTLTEEEINPLYASISRILTERFSAQIR